MIEIEFEALLEWHDHVNEAIRYMSNAPSEPFPGFECAWSELHVAKDMMNEVIKEIQDDEEG